MKRLRDILIIICFLNSSIASGQDISEKYPELIKRVRLINEDNSLTKVTLTNEEFLTQMTDGGGELIGYFKNGQIQKITLKIGLSYGIETYDYYFTSRQLIFAYELLNGFIYNESISKFDYTKTEINFIGRYYFRNNKLIDSETTGHNRFEDDTLDIETTLIKEMNEYLDKLKRKSKNNAR
jgi:hypothetical protein